MFDDLSLEQQTRVVQQNALAKQDHFAPAPSDSLIFQMLCNLKQVVKREGAEFHKHWIEIKRLVNNGKPNHSDFTTMSIGTVVGHGSMPANCLPVHIAALTLLPSWLHHGEIMRFYQVLCHKSSSVLDSFSGQGKTALYRAICAGNVEFARAILSAGACPTILIIDRFNNFMSAVDLSIWSGTTQKMKNVYCEFEMLLLFVVVC